MNLRFVFSLFFFEWLLFRVAGRFPNVQFANVLGRFAKVFSVKAAFLEFDMFLRDNAGQNQLRYGGH